MAFGGCEIESEDGASNLELQQVGLRATGATRKPMRLQTPLARKLCAGVDQLIPDSLVHRDQ